MAHITFYDCTDSDRETIATGLAPTDHYASYHKEGISLDNLEDASEVISVFVSSKVTKEIIDRLPRLTLIACRSTGFNNIDLEACKARSITVVNVPTYGERTVAEYAFGLLLTLTRKLREAVEVTKAGSMSHETLVGMDLAGKTFGVIGTGKIGRSSLQIAKGFQMETLGYDPFPNEKAATELGYQNVSLAELLQRSDIISLHAPYTQENRHLIDNEQFSQMKPGAILINTARGELVNNKALLHALESGKVAAVGLDTLEGEELLCTETELHVLDECSMQHLVDNLEISALLKLPQVVVTNHNAFNTKEAIARINETTVFNVTRFWYGEIPNKVAAPEPKKQTSGLLILIRHGESEWNAAGKWTGTTDVHLSPKGYHESAMMGEMLKDLTFDKAYYSQQIRSLETLEGVLDASGQLDTPYERTGAINERDYGVYTGKNKWEVQKEIGEEAFLGLRRGWNYPVPEGETLKMVYERVVPFYKETVLPQLRAGKNILLSAHGNSIRALIKYIETIADDKIGDVEMIFGKALIYTVDENGKMTTKAVRHIDSPPPPA